MVLYKYCESRITFGYVRVLFRLTGDLKKAVNVCFELPWRSANKNKTKPIIQGPLPVTYIESTNSNG